MEGVYVQQGARFRALVFASVASIDMVARVTGHKIGSDRIFDETWEFTINAAADRVGQTFELPSNRAPFDMVVFSAHITSVAGAIKRGQLYVRLQVLGRGAVLLQGYVYSGHMVRFPERTESMSGRGLKVDNEAASTLVNNVALTRIISVPNQARWEIEGGKVLNGDNVARNCSVDARDGSNQQLMLYMSEVSIGASGDRPYPTSESVQGGGVPSGRLTLVEGDDVAILFAAGGVSAGGTGRSSLVVQEWIEE